MKLQKYIIEIILITITVFLIIIIFRNFKSDTPIESYDDFDVPDVQEAEIKNVFGIKLELSDPSVFSHVMLSGKVTTEKGDVDLGNFVVRDIRLWRVDGERIIDDTFLLDSKPLYITINQKSGTSEKVIFEGEISDSGEIQSVNDNFNSSLRITISTK